MIRNYPAIKALSVGLFTLFAAVTTFPAIAADRSAVYTVQGPRNVDSYKNSDVIAAVTDPDGPIVKATMQGGVLPNGTALNTLTGTISVVQAASLSPGVFNVTIRTKDSSNGNTTKNITINILADIEATIVVLPVQHFLDYTEGDTLINFVDINGPIVSAKLISGVIPSGARLDTISGSLLVTQPAQLQSSSWDFTLTTTDVTGGGTTTPVTYMFDPSSPLPVCWKSFEVQRQGSAVTLEWTTACEKDNDKFIVMRSADGKTFQAIGEMLGARNTSSSRSYQFTDNQPLFGFTYYKLKQLDLNGTANYSVVRFVKGDQSEAMLKVWPNPTAGVMELAVSGITDAELILQVFTLDGRMVKNQLVAIGQRQISLGDLPAGAYLLQLKGELTQLSQRIIKQ